MEFTVEQLAQAIREAGSLNELLKLVGPSDEENEEAEARFRLLDRLPPNHPRARDAEAAQRVFEERYF